MDRSDVAGEVSQLYYNGDPVYRPAAAEIDIERQETGVGAIFFSATSAWEPHRCQIGRIFGERACGIR